MLQPLTSLAAAILIALTPEANAQCLLPKEQVAGWPVAKSPRLPGVELRLPPALRRDTAEDAYALESAPRGSLWADTHRTQVSVFLTDSVQRLFVTLPARIAGRAEFSRCESVVGTGRLTVVAYNKREWVGDMAFIGPFQVFAEYRAQSGARIQFSGSSESRARFEQLKMAAYTIRTHAPQRALPNDR